MLSEHMAPIGDLTVRFPPLLKNARAAAPERVTATATPETAPMVVHRYRNTVEPRNRKANRSIAEILLVTRWEYHFSSPSSFRSRFQIYRSAESCWKGDEERGFKAGVEQ